MPDGDSGNYDFVLPEVNASAGTWGDKLNTNLQTVDGILSDLASQNLPTLSAAGGSASFGISAGAAGDSGGRLMKLGSALTKTTSVWAVGNNQGALDTGSIDDDETYHVFLIRRPDTGVVDILVSLSPSAPTMPSNYTQKRRIGSMLTDGASQWIKFSQKGDEFLLDAPVQDYSNIPSGVDTALALPLSVPTGIQVEALFDVTSVRGVSDAFVRWSSLDQADVAASASAFTMFVNSFANYMFMALRMRTDTSARVRFRASATDMNYYVTTRGWVDTRGRV